MWLNSWFSAFILLQLDYCNSRLSCLPGSSIQPLQRVMNAAARVIMNLSLRNHVKPALKQLRWLPVEKRITYSCVCLCTTSTSDKHQNTCQTVYPQFLQPVADTGWGPLAQRLTFCQEQEHDLVNMASYSPVQPPGTLFHPTFMTLPIRVYSENDSIMYFLIVLITDYCWYSWPCRIAAPYISRVDWLIDTFHPWYSVYRRYPTSNISIGLTLALSVLKAASPLQSGMGYYFLRWDFLHVLILLNFTWKLAFFLTDFFPVLSTPVPLSDCQPIPVHWLLILYQHPLQKYAY